MNLLIKIDFNIDSFCASQAKKKIKLNILHILKSKEPFQMVQSEFGHLHNITAHAISYTISLQFLKQNDNTSWNTPVPQFSYCLQDTFCVWIPASIFLLLIPWEVHRHKKKRTWEVDWSVRIIIRCVVISIIIALNLIALILAVYRNSSGYDTSLSEIIGPLISIVVQIMTLSLTIISKKRRMVTSPSQFYYWLLNTVAELLKYYSLVSELLNQPQNPELSRLIITLAALPLSLLVFLFNILPDRINLKSVKQKSLNNIGFHLASASYVKQILFAWVFPIIRLGNRKTITKDEVWSLKPSHKTDFLYKKFLYNWKKEQRSCLEIDILSFSLTLFRYNMKNPGKNKKPGIIITLLKSFWRDLAFGTSIRLTIDMLQYINPVLLNILISFISSNEPTWKGVLYSIGIAAVIYIRETGNSHYYDKQMSLCVRIKGSLTMAIYKKGLMLSNSARQNYSIGSMVNLLAVDLQKFQDLVLYVPQLWMAPIIITIGIVQLWGVLGISCLSGIGVIVFFIPYSFIFTKTQDVYQEKVMHLSDKRLKVTNEVLSGVKVLKLYAWENPFKDTIKDIRTQEVKMIIGCIMSQSATEVAWQNVPTLISLASFATYVYIDKNNVLTPNVAFVSIALFNLIKVPMMLFPAAFSTIVEARVSINRIDNFLNSEELSDFEIKQDTDEGHQLSIENGFFSWDSADKNSILENINIKVKPGELVAVVGKVGSGKSSLISSLLGEMHRKQGKVFRKGSIAYVPQVAWIQNNTVQQNITFTSEFKRKKYNKVIDACALRPDFDIMIAGDQTEIGEKGVNISGGQKQRISLARAVYSDADIYLLDDTLSAVDAHVGTHIFKGVLGPEGILKSKTRFMTTNSLTFLPECDQIIVLINGKISETGKYSELVQKSGAFAELVLQYASEDNSKETVQNLEAFESILEDKNVPEEFKRGKLIDEEEMETGSVSLEVYWTYIKQLGVLFAIASFLSYFITEGSSVLANIWLSLWSDQSLQDSIQHSNGYWLGIYAAFGINSIIFYISALFFLCYGHIRASANLHLRMLDAILRAPMSFFDTTPLGRIINRFSKDVNTMDIILLIYIKMFLIFGIKVLGAVITITTQTPLIIIPIIPMVVIYLLIQNLYLKSSRQLKRIEAVTRSPMFSNFSESVTGASTIRAYRAHDVFAKIFQKNVDINQSSFYVGYLTARWLEVSTVFIGSSLVLFSALFSVLYRGQIEPGAAGLSVTYAISIMFFLNVTIQLASFVETNIVSAERILEYSKVTPEAPWEIPHKKPSSNWPQEGVIEFKNYKTKYRSDLPLVLKGISFQTKPGEKIGVCGRTGAGKSSLTLALFRIIEATSGDIILDTVNISKIGLHDLRSRLTIIPQDPILFTGNLRFNLDPLKEHTDDEIWHALELSHLKNFVLSLDGCLDSTVSEGGGNISVGQRQLVCLARALLRQTKVLILDEATAAVDLQTDDFIQETIRKQFHDCTIITIAHRLNTIMDSSRILVLSDGEIVESNTPSALLENKDSIFYGMVKDAGISDVIE
ncbi:Multidrug resistance-associated protein 1 [Nymphon striatum]|nr:Multidrug resistance-associated protein 1 [Nymphon striatum]